MKSSRMGVYAMYIKVSMGAVSSLGLAVKKKAFRRPDNVCVDFFHDEGTRSRKL